MKEAESVKKKKVNPHAGHRERLRKRFLSEGAEGFEKHELLELLLFGMIPMQDTNPIAHRLLDAFHGSMSMLLNSDYREIVKNCNVSMNTAIFLNTMAAVIKVCQREAIEDKVVLENTKVTGEYAKHLLFQETVEKFYILCLDAGNHLIKSVQIAKGSVRTAQVEVAAVVKEAVLNNAVSVILVHNHPGGSLRPSAKDIHLTHEIVTALGLVHIVVADHVITAKQQYFSFVENGLLETKKDKK